MSLKKNVRPILGLAILIAFALYPGEDSIAAQAKKAMTVQDVMKFKSIAEPVISENGLYVAYASQPDRGDGEVRVKKIGGQEETVIERGGRPQFSKNSRWLAMTIKPKAADVESQAKDKPKQGMALLDNASGKIVRFENVDRFLFSDDSAWLAYLHFKEEEKAKDAKETDAVGKGKTSSEPAKPKMKDVGSTLVLRHLGTDRETKVPFVMSYAFDSRSKFLAITVFDPEGKDNGVDLLELSRENLPVLNAAKAEKGNFTQLTWSKDGGRLAFCAASFDDKGQSSEASLWTWDAKSLKAFKAVVKDAAPQGFVIPSRSRLTWSQDGKRLFFGFQSRIYFDLARKNGKDEKKTGDSDFFSIDAILEKREADVWHWNDPLINSQQKKSWTEIRDRMSLAVWHAENGKTVPLATQDMRTVEIPDNPRIALGLADVPYLKEITWDGSYSDVYLVDLNTGQAKKIVEHLSGRPTLSPEGRFVVYYRDKNWYLYDVKSGVTKNLTDKLGVAFWREDHDTPDDPPGYGIGGWIEGDAAVLIYDKYDIWKIPTASAAAVNLTAGEGRKSDLTFRILKTDPEIRFFKADDDLLISAYHNHKKFQGFYATRLNATGVEKKLEDNKRLTFISAAKRADAVLFSRETHEEYPDLWVSPKSFVAPVKISDLGAQTRDFAWGTAELVEWISLDGLPLQGVLIKPGNYDPAKRYPVLVYFYELSSQRLHEFNQIVVNHRPCFPYYASNGYALFLPDVVFEIGHPGQSAIKCIIPGVQKLIDMGVADPKTIGLHGHSWSGYQTAYMVTQTNLFACGIAGAAVTNMTSAYDGIRWESGVARQFQYEKSQSRIGGSLWEFPERFIENSAVFFADRIKTPLLLMHGDEDGAVPWYQSIELYLAMRRLGKNCIFLQYRGEPHHPQKYANKLDYTIKFKQYLDHYLKGEPAADWIKNGVPYMGK